MQGPCVKAKTRQHVAYSETVGFIWLHPTRRSMPLCLHAWEELTSTFGVPNKSYGSKLWLGYGSKNPRGGVIAVHVFAVAQDPHIQFLL